jgi:hypothetical protein
MAAPHIAALQAAGFAMQADLLPLATNVQLAAATAPLATNVQLAAATAPLATNVQLIAMQANMNAQLVAMQGQLVAMQAQLALIGIPAIAAAASASVQAIANARVVNNHYRSGVAYAVVPRADGTPPPNWPIGFDRAMLRSGPIGAVNLLLTDYGLVPPAPALDRRNLLALHIGTADL